ncbi:hypothetical protein PI125_g15123 [Phytophthora idaei]|nr:hypothetical protein PI125_g15123 [Phytophthora idaei]
MVRSDLRVAWARSHSVALSVVARSQLDVFSDLVAYSYSVARSQAVVLSWSVLLLDTE